MMAANKNKTQDWLSNKDWNSKGAFLWANGMPYWDTTLKIIGQEGEVEGTLKVHKLILGMGSRKFAMDLYLTSDSDENQKQTGPLIVEVRKVSVRMMEFIVEFIYTDAIKGTGSMEWAEVGGLIEFAKEYGMPRLIEYCTEFFGRTFWQRPEKAMALVLELNMMRLEQCKWPKGFYREIMKLCLAIILRNGDEIMRSSNLVKLTIEQLEMLIGSDFLCVSSEAEVFRGLLKWAKAQCGKKGLDPYRIENLKNTLRKPSEGNKSLGLLKYVRFSVYAEDEYSTARQSSSEAIIFRNMKEFVERSHVPKEPTGIFSEKERRFEVYEEENDDFFSHIDQITSKFLSLQDATLPTSSQHVNAKPSKSSIFDVNQEVDIKTQSTSAISDPVGPKEPENSPGPSSS